MMGREVRDPEGIEGDIASLPGLGILPVTTTLAGGKQTRQCSFTFIEGNASGQGYEIHAGKTPSNAPLCRLDNGETDGYFLNENTWGTYIHGIFDNASVIDSVLRRIDPEFVSATDYKARKEEGYDRLAQVIRDNVDIRYIYNCLKI